MVLALNRLWRDSRGNSLIELAIALPVLLYLSLGFVDLARGFAFRMTLKQAAQSGADFVAANGINIPADADIIAQVAAASGLPSSNIAISRLTQCNYQSMGPYANCSDNSAVRVNYLVISVTGTYTPVVSLPMFDSFAPPAQQTQKITIRLP